MVPFELFCEEELSGVAVIHSCIPMTYIYIIYYMSYMCHNIYKIISIYILMIDSNYSLVKTQTLYC